MLGVVTKKAFQFLILAVLPGATAGAQDWSELDTLTFNPVSFQLSLAPATVDATENGIAEPLLVSERDRIPVTSSRSVGADDELAPQLIISRIRAAVEDIESAAAAYGENSPRLVPLLRTLAEIYQETGDLGDATQVLERAQQVVRRSDGLYSLDQADLIRQMIEIDMAITPNEQSSELESDLRQLVQRNPGDPRNGDILTSMAARQMDVASDLLINGLPPAIVFNVDLVGGLGQPRYAPPTTARAMAASMLRRARSSYSSAMREAVSKEPANIPELLELEQTIIDTYYFELMNSRFRRRHQPYTAAGRLRFGGVRALSARLENSRRFPGTPEAYSSALIELADWHLMFNSFGRAMETYEAARAHLLAQDDGAKRVAAMLSPEAPVPLPAFVPTKNVYSGLGDVHGYIDVEIEINRFGGVRNVNVVGQSQTASAPVARRLRRFVFQTRFRPRFAGGEWQRSDRFALRYEFGYSST